MDEKEMDPLTGIMHCPVCGRELGKDDLVAKGWQCRCGELVPEGMALNSVEGCTHGRECNCSRSMRR